MAEVVTRAAIVAKSDDCATIEPEHLSKVFPSHCFFLTPMSRTPPQVLPQVLLDFH